MPVCRICGNRFHHEDAEDFFLQDFGTLSYSNFKEPLCGSCAVDIIENAVDGYYFETCEQCGCEFDLFVDDSTFSNSISGSDLRDTWQDKILCANCAIAYVESLHSDDDDDYDEERLSVEEAALIWRSHGRDEDYTFGYSEDELENN